MSVEESHGIFQFTDDFFSDENVTEAYVAPEYTPRQVVPQWYVNEHTGHEHENGILAKYRIDHLYSLGHYTEGMEMGLKHLETSQSKRREMYEAILVCSAKCGNSSVAQNILEHLYSLNVEDSGLEYICNKVKAQLSI